jgi:hypothetical protein
MGRTLHDLFSWAAILLNPHPMNVSTHGRSQQPRMVFAQWWGLLGPPSMWLAQFQARYALAGDETGTTAQWVMVVIAIAALAIVGSCALTARRQWRLAEASPLDRAAGVGDRARFMGALGLLSSGLFALAIAAQVLAQFFISPGKS